MLESDACAAFYRLSLPLWLAFAAAKSSGRSRCVGVSQRRRESGRNKAGPNDETRARVKRGFGCDADVRSVRLIVNLVRAERE